jgi:type II secretory pathway component PulJ
MMKDKGNRNGFSMIEVLVASSILIVIVMMLAMLFQQTSVAWRTGLIRSRGYAQLRSYVGTIQRDATAAIDARNLPAKLLESNGKQSFTSGKISFYTLSGDENDRSLNYITHDLSGTREHKVLALDGNGKWDTVSSSDVLKFLSDSNSDDPDINPLRFEFKWEKNGSYSDELPLYIKVDAQVTQKGKLYQVGAASAGPDKIWGTKDDIRTWVE